MRVPGFLRFWLDHFVSFGYADTPSLKWRMPTSRSFRSGSRRSKKREDAKVNKFVLSGLLGLGLAFGAADADAETVLRLTSQMPAKHHICLLYTSPSPRD